VSAKKIRFGSGQVGKILSPGISENDRRLIFYENAMTLLGLK